MKKQKYILCLLLLIFSQGISGQNKNLIFQHLTRRNGLPVDAVTCLAQDSTGFIWIGSSEGLYRYDGISFKSFHYDRNSKSSIQSNVIKKIYVASSGLIWVATVQGGVVVMNSEGGCLRLINSSVDSSFSINSDFVTDITEEPGGAIWITTWDGMFQIAGDFKAHRYGIPARRTYENTFFNLQIGPGQMIWAGTYYGLRLFDTRKKTFISFRDPRYKIKELQYKLPCRAMMLHENHLWYSTWDPELTVYDLNQGTNNIIYSGRGSQKPDYSRIANAFLRDKRNILWIGTGKGLYIKIPDHPAVEGPYINEPGNLYSISDNTVNTILEDRDGNLWFGTNNGISIARPYNLPVSNFSYNNAREYPFATKKISDLIEISNHRFLIGTSEADGIYLTDSSFKVLKKFTFNTIKYDWVWKHYYDTLRNRILISTQNGMLVYNPSTGVMSIDKKEEFKKWYPVSSFISISDSICWMSRLRGTFVRYNLNTRQYQEFDLPVMGINGIVSSLEKDRDNNIWVLAGDGGLIRLNEKTGRITDHLEVKKGHQSLQEGGVYFFRDMGPYFVIGYQNRGIGLFDKSTRTFQQFSISDGLISDCARDAVLANDGNLWIATINGIICLNPRTKKFKSFGYEDGILVREFENIRQLSDGRIVAGGINGMIAFQPLEMDKLRAPPLPPIFTGIDVYGTRLSADSLLKNNRPLYIPHKKNHFAVDFISLQFARSGHLEYAYKLEGQDKDWIDAGDRRYVSYSNIAGGRYTLRVRVREPGETWVESPTPLAVIIQTPFFRKWWFYLAIMVTVAGLVYTIFRYRLQQLIKIERIRTTLSSDLHDEVGASLSSISFFSEMALRKLDPGSKEKEFLDRIGSRSRETIEKMSDIVWSINPDNDSLEQIIIRMKNYSIEVTEAREIITEWNITGDPVFLKLGMDQRKNFYLLFKEIINNAVKHSGAAKITVDLSITTNNIKLHIADDGAGFDPSRKTEGNGISNIRRRATALKSEIRIDSEKGKGTSVTLQFPVR